MASRASPMSASCGDWESPLTSSAPSYRTSCRCQAATSTPPRSSIAHVGVDGYITHRSNLYSVPFSHIGQVLYVRHRDGSPWPRSAWKKSCAMRSCPAPRPACGNCSKAHHPVDDPIDRTTRTLRRTRPGRLAVPRRPARQADPGQAQAQQLLALIAQYQRDDVCAPNARPLRPFSLAAIRRILAATAKPKQWPTNLSTCTTRCPSLREDRSVPRPASETINSTLPEEPVS